LPAGIRDGHANSFTLTQIYRYRQFYCESFDRGNAPGCCVGDSQQVNAIKPVVSITGIIYIYITDGT
jgi:hypothetical protein